MKNTVKILAIALILLAGVFVLTSCSRPAATVNGQAITYKQLDTELEARYGKLVLDELVMKALVEQAAKKNNIVISNDELNKEFDKIKNHPYFEQIIKMQNVSIEGLKKDLKMELVLKQLIAKKAGDEELKKFYDANSDKIKQIKISYIACKSEADAKVVLDLLNKGEDFAKVAKEMSADEESRDKGGAVGYVPKVGVDSNFGAEVSSLPVGKISGIIKRDKAYYIIKVEDKKETYDQLASETTQLFASPEKKREYIDELRKDAKVKLLFGEPDKKEEKAKDEKKK